MKYRELIKKAKAQTVSFIENNDWKQLFRIFQTVPKQIYFFSNILEENIINFFKITDNPFIVLRSEGEIVYYKFNELYELILKLIRSKIDIFSKRFRNLICDKIFSQISRVKVYNSTIDLFVDVLHPEIINISKEELMNHLYNSRILYRLEA